MRTSVVLGSCFGDESKGNTVNFLTNSKESTLVVRFNGGHQAGHTVTEKGIRHIFSSFGSGTLKGAHSYWSEYCTFYPKAFFNEKEALIKNGFNPIHYIHPLSMVVTPFDISFNRELEKTNNHGSVGLGFGATVNRNQNTPFKLYAIDLVYKDILVYKLKSIANYYKIEKPEEEIDEFIHYTNSIKLNIKSLSEIKDNYGHIIFEGAQGIMLDMDFGYFPNVTRSNTTSKNAMEIIKNSNLPEPQIYYVIRSYLTRHGIGYMPNEDLSLKFEDLTNKLHPYQGNFRKGYHSLSQVKYAINCDNIFSGSNYSKKNLVITCMDQTQEKILIDNLRITKEEFLKRLDFPFDKIIQLTTKN